MLQPSVAHRMPPPREPAPRGSRLLASLPPDELAYVRPLLSEVRLRPGTEVMAAGARLDHALFIGEGLVSMMIAAGAGRSVATRFVGPEGMLGLSVVFGARTMPFAARCHVAGFAYRIAADALANALAECEALRRAVLRFAHEAMLQVSGTAACQAVPVERRLARWLLLARDRMGAEELPLTHEELARIVGVRRASLTLATHVLEASHAIKAVRGRIIIRSPDILRAVAGDSYDPVAAA